MTAQEAYEELVLKIQALHDDLADWKIPLTTVESRLCEILTWSDLVHG